MKTILVAIDYSAPASNALDYAALMAKETGAQLVLLNVYKLSIHASNSLASNNDVQQLMKKSEDRLIEFALAAEDKYQISVGYELGKNDTVESLKKYVSEHKVDLVVMGIQSDLIEYKWFGNTTTDAIQLMKFPLLVVPNDVPYMGISRILYACAPAFLKQDCQLDVLKQFVREMNAELEVFHVLTNGEGTNEREKLQDVMGNVLHDLPHTYGYVVNQNVEDGIVEGLHQSPADLLVMVPHKIGFFESLFKGSHTSQMTVRTHVPLLVIPNEVVC
jgi:nucleotide-binding universal stress UspA family protein